MEEARRVLERLERIEALDRGKAPAEELLGELRELLREAEEWALVERQQGQLDAAITRCRSALERANDEEAVLLGR